MGWISHFPHDCQNFQKVVHCSVKISEFHVISNISAIPCSVDIFITHVKLMDKRWRPQLITSRAVYLYRRLWSLLIVNSHLRPCWKIVVNIVELPLELEKLGIVFEVWSVSIQCLARAGSACTSRNNSIFSAVWVNSEFQREKEGTE